MHLKKKKKSAQTQKAMPFLGNWDLHTYTSSFLLLARYTLHYNGSFILLQTKESSSFICNMSLLLQYKCVALKIKNIIFYTPSRWKVSLHSHLQFCFYTVILLVLYRRTRSLIDSQIPTDLKLPQLCSELESTW